MPCQGHCAWAAVILFHCSVVFLVYAARLAGHPCIIIISMWISCQMKGNKETKEILSGSFLQNTRVSQNLNTKQKPKCFDVCLQFHPALKILSFCHKNELNRDNTTLWHSHQQWVNHLHGWEGSDSGLRSKKSFSSAERLTWWLLLGRDQLFSPTLDYTHT